MTFERPRLIPILFILLSTALLVGLGSWQLVRLQWKEALIRQVESAQDQPALGSLPPLDSAQDMQALAFRRASLTGHFLHEHTLHMVGRPKQAGSGTANGFFLLTPFRLEDDGRIILVSRGFSLIGKETRPEGVQTVSGIFRPLRQQRAFAPDNKPGRNVWVYEDIPAMSQASNLSLLPVVLEAVGPMEKDVFPIPHDGQIRLLNNHLYYAITWFSIAIVGIIMFIIYHRSPKR